LRKQTIGWLKAELTSWSRLLEAGPPRARQAVAQILQRWKADPDLAGLRDQAALAKLPQAEQHACGALFGVALLTLPMP
jgi:hypothetical protein